MKRLSPSIRSKVPSLPLLVRLGRRDILPLLAAFVGAALLLAFGMLAEEVVEGDTQKVDTALLMKFRTPGDPTDLIGPEWFEEMVRDVTALGSYAFIFIVVLVCAGYLLLLRKRGLALLLVAAEGGGMLISNLLKNGFDRPRPDIEHAARVFTASFPSGHATLSAVTFLTLGALLTRVSPSRRANLYFMSVAVVLTLLVGTSRVYLGVHYPSDVIAGWCVGSAWAALCWAVALWLQRRGSVEGPAPRGGE
ncbi:MAG TPA: phosphatase PAP2 family protein [Sphingomicrobium sp.]|nr:phosphatase PAP2 family protein [Sphingomicrobium sp.]